MRLTPSEAKLIELIGNAGGSYCPGRDTPIHSEVRRILRRMERKGLIIVDDTDDGPRFTLSDACHA